MFYRLKRWLRSKNTKTIDSIKYQVQTLERHLERLSDELTLLGKLTNKRETVTISVPYFSCFGGDTAKMREEYMIEQREKRRLEGYSFCHNKKNGEEIWAKY
jgi:hypothetical protein